MDPTTTKVETGVGVLHEPASDALVAAHGTALLDPRIEARPARPAILNATPGPLELLLALQRRWLFAVTVALLLGVPAAVTTWFAVPQTYETYSMLRVRQGPGVLYDLKTELLSLPGQRTLIKSAYVINAALSMQIKTAQGEQSVANQPWIAGRAPSKTEVEWLAQQLDVRSSGGSGGSMGDILQIGMKGDDPQQLEVLVNAITRAYLDRVAGEEKTLLNVRRNLLETNYYTKYQEVNRRRELVYKIANRVGTGDTKTAQNKQELLLDFVLTLRREITQRRATILQKEQALKHFKRTNGLEGDANSPLPESLVEEAASTDSEYLDLMKSVRQMEERLAQMLKVVKNPNSPSIRAAREAIAQAQKLAEDRKKLVREQLQKDWKDGKIVNAKVEELKGRTEELELLKAEYKEMETQFQDLTQKMEDLGTSTEELDRRKEDLATALVTANRLGLALEQYDLESRSENRVTLLQDAPLPRTELGGGNRRLQYTAMFGLGAMCIGLALVSLWEFHARRITSNLDVNDGLGVRVIGDVPMLSQSGRHWWGHASGNSENGLQGVMDESIDGVRAMLLHSAGGDAVRIVMVTSAKAGEGKTTVAVSLAASLGRCGRRTLLIDGDLRRPNVHRLLDLPLDKGLAEVLRGEATLEEVIRPSRATGMWVMSAGHCDQVSLQALTKNVLAQLLETLRTEFDSIVIDTGPVLAVVDPLLLGQHCDGAILSIVHRVSQITPVYETCERLKATGIRVLGCVVNGSPRSAFGLNHGYYGYGYGYGYGHGNGHAASAAANETPTTETT